MNLLEKYNINNSDSIISLTNSAKTYLQKKYFLNSEKIFVIPTCVDTSRFKFSIKPTSKINKFSCIGTVLSDWFLLDWLKRFFSCVQEIDNSAELEIITRDDKGIVKSKLGFSGHISKKVKIKSAYPEEIPYLIKNHAASAMFFTPGISKLGSSPTRFGEILSVGRPVICNSGVGDLDSLIKKNNVGVIVQDEKISSMKKAVFLLYELISNPETPKRCRGFGNRFLLTFFRCKNIHQYINYC